mmetsp:Transcript_24113/g.81399  ORF Transcript_24113/g.81399 Transcript_24113/m.81399 type:complete len:453 (+) Transcript_24113:82-1440(+)
MAKGDDSAGMTALGVVAVIMLFFLIMGLAGSVDIHAVKAQFHRRLGICCGLLCQFFIMPFICFLLVTILKPRKHVGMTLLILCSSSGGAYSNWWCSLFNADLALSVAMTAVSTLISAFMLPVNLSLYVSLLDSEAGVPIPWGALLQGIGSIAAAIITGIAVSTKFPQWKGWMSKIGNVSGVCMILLTAIVAVLPKKPPKGEERGTPLWGKEASFYFVVASPFFVSLVMSMIISSLPCLKLSKPERVAITIEVCYQNIGIASAVALAAFNGSPAMRADAAAVPVIYGLVEAVSLGIFCIIAWKAGWSYAPAEDSFLKVVRNNYQPRTEAPSEVEVQEADHQEERSDLEQAAIAEDKPEFVDDTKSGSSTQEGSSVHSTPIAGAAAGPDGAAAPIPVTLRMPGVPSEASVSPRVGVPQSVHYTPTASAAGTAAPSAVTLGMPVQWAGEEVEERE